MRALAKPRCARQASLNFYVYYPEQSGGYGDHLHPTGGVWKWRNVPIKLGPNFKKRPEFVPALDRWYCYEFMVKTNTPGIRDGRIATWVDGKLAADIPNFRLRDVDTLKIDQCSLSLHLNCKTQYDNKKSYANVVMASSYIGPMMPEKPKPPKPVAKETPKPQAPVAQKPPPVIAASALAPWELKLTQRVAQGVKDGQSPTVWLKLMNGREEAVKVAGADEKSLSLEQGGGGFPSPGPGFRRTTALIWRAPS